MDVITMEATAYKELIRKIEKIADYVFKKESKPNEEEEIWLDNQEVCLILKIAPRTLQNLRDTDQISYSQIGKKIYYKKEDIQKFIEKHNSHEQSNHTR